MAIRNITETENQEGLLFKLDNGDQKALDLIQEKWGFKDKESALRFALAVLYSSADTKKLYVVESSGKTSPLFPNSALLTLTANESK